MKTYSQAFTSGEKKIFHIPGKMFRYISGANAAAFEFYQGGRVIDLGDCNALSAGFWSRPEGGFDGFAVTSGGAETALKFGISNGQTGLDQFSISGTIVAENVGDAFTPAAVTVTNASGVLLVANAARRYLLIQNQDSSGDIYIQPKAAAAVASAACIKIPAGGYWEPLVCPIGEIRAIGSVASNANIHVSEA